MTCEEGLFLKKAITPMVLESDRVSGLPSVSFVVGAASRCLLSVRGFVFVFF